MDKQRVLIVDTNPALRSLLRTYLFDAGFSIDEASDGDTAIALALARPVDLVLLEAMIPGSSGTYVLREIRARSEIRVILMSTLSVAELVDIADNAHGYIRKPFRPSEVVEKVVGLLSSSAR